MLETCLTDDRIAAVPKEVFTTDDFDTAFSGLDRADALRAAEIIFAIQHGKALPGFAYRPGIDNPNDVDDLLKATGWMHLHFHSTDDDWLIYLKQFDTYVILAGIARHTPHFRKPYGTELKRKWGTKVPKLQAKIETERRKRASDETE